MLVMKDNSIILVILCGVHTDCYTHPALLLCNHISAVAVGRD